MFDSRVAGGVYFVILKTTPIAIFASEYSLETKSSSLLEYALIPLIGAYLYSDTKIKKSIFFLLAMCFLLLPLLYGKRLAFLMIALLIFNLFFSKKIKIKTILIGVISLSIALRLFALFRVGLTGDNIDWLFLVLGIKNEVMSNNQGGVMVCSVTYLNLINEGVFDFYFRVKSLLGVFSNIFLPSSMNFEETYINLYTMKYITAIPGNGGFTSVYLYLWGGILAVIWGALAFNKILRNPRKSRLVAVYGIFVMATFPRWYAYNMLILVKMGFWLLLFIVLLDLFDRTMRKIK